MSIKWLNWTFPNVNRKFCWLSVLTKGSTAEDSKDVVSLSSRCSNQWENCILWFPGRKLPFRALKVISLSLLQRDLKASSTRPFLVFHSSCHLCSFTQASSVSHGSYRSHSKQYCVFLKIEFSFTCYVCLLFTGFCFEYFRRNIWKHTHHIYWNRNKPITGFFNPVSYHSYFSQD